MLCDQHKNVTIDPAYDAVRQCSECGCQTHFPICRSCAEGFDQCIVCRADLHSGVHPLLLAAFKLPAAAQARADIKRAIEAESEAIRLAQEQYHASMSGPRRVCETAYQSAQETVAAAHASDPKPESVEARTQALASVRAEADALAKPAVEAYKLALAPIDQSLSASVTQAKATSRIRQDAAYRTLESIMRQADADVAAGMEERTVTETRCLWTVASALLFDAVQWHQDLVSNADWLDTDEFNRNRVMVNEFRETREQARVVFDDAKTIERVVMLVTRVMKQPAPGTPVAPEHQLLTEATATFAQAVSQFHDALRQIMSAYKDRNQSWARGDNVAAEAAIAILQACSAPLGTAELFCDHARSIFNDAVALNHLQ